MACKASFVSILNNDDNPSFTVRSAPKLTRHHSSPAYPYHPDQPQSSQEYRFAYPESTASSPRLVRYRFDPVSEATQPVSPGSSDCSHDYMSSTTSYFQYRQDAYSYSSNMSMTEKRLSGASSAEPPSPQTSTRSKDTTTSKGTRKNKYPCPYAISHNCSATFTTSGHAARHGKKHTGEKSVHCPICNKAFTRKDNMKQHIRTHRTHSEDMPTGAPETKENESSGWTTTTRQSGQSHSRSISQSQVDNTYHSVAGMPTRTPSGSHRRVPF